MFGVEHSGIFADLVFGGETQQVAESLHPFAQGKEMAGDVPVQREPNPDTQIQRNANQQVDQNCRLYTSTVGFQVQGKHLFC